jgi:hypothetical protein
LDPPSFICILKFLCRIRSYLYIRSYTIVLLIIKNTHQSQLVHVLIAGGRNAKTAHKLSHVSPLAALYFYVHLYHSAVIFFVIFTDSICIVNTCHNTPTSTCIHLPCLFVFMTTTALCTLKSTQTEHALIESHASGLVVCPYNCRSSQNERIHPKFGNAPISETVLQKPNKHCTAFYFLAPKGRVLYLTPKFSSAVEHS